MIDANVWLRLADFFDPGEVKFKPQAISGNRAMCIHYVDARVIMDRLDHVVGPDNWQDHYEVLGNGCVECRLAVRFGTEWLEKCDVGSPSEQPDDGDKTKAAFSDALKRAAVKWGIGRYLYRIAQSWVDYDPAKRRVVKPPVLPEWCKKPMYDRISYAQQQELCRLMLDAKLSQGKFCAGYKIASIAELVEQKYAEAVASVGKFKEREAKSDTAKNTKPKENAA